MSGLKISNMNSLTSLPSDSYLEVSVKKGLDDWTTHKAQLSTLFIGGLEHSGYGEKIDGLQQEIEDNKNSIETLSNNQVSALTNYRGEGNFGLNLSENQEIGEKAIVLNEECGAPGEGSLATGTGTLASGNFSFAQGYRNQATGKAAHAEGYTTVAEGEASHAEGKGTIASGNYQSVRGEYNEPSTDYLEIVGNGYGENSRSNAYTLDKDGNAYYAGAISAQGATFEEDIVGRNLQVDNAEIKAILGNESIITEDLTATNSIMNEATITELTVTENSSFTSFPTCDATNDLSNDNQLINVATLKTIFNYDEETKTLDIRLPWISEESLPCEEVKVNGTTIFPS